MKIFEACGETTAALVVSADKRVNRAMVEFVWGGGSGDESIAKLYKKLKLPEIKADPKMTDDEEDIEEKMYDAVNTFIEDCTFSLYTEDCGDVDIASIADATKWCKEKKFSKADTAKVIKKLSKILSEGEKCDDEPAYTFKSFE